MIHVCAPCMLKHTKLDQRIKLIHILAWLKARKTMVSTAEPKHKVFNTFFPLTYKEEKQILAVYSTRNIHLYF